MWNGQKKEERSYRKGAYSLMAILFSMSLIFPAKGFAKVEDFNKAVELESLSHQERIKILQEAETCIKNAKSKEEFKRCEEIEKQKREALKTKHFEMRKKLILEQIDQHIAKLQEKKTCVLNAQNPEQLKNCHKK